MKDRIEEIGVKSVDNANAQLTLESKSKRRAFLIVFQTLSSSVDLRVSSEVSNKNGSYLSLVKVVFWTPERKLYSFLKNAGKGNTPSLDTPRSSSRCSKVSLMPSSPKRRLLIAVCTFVSGITLAEL
jgi:hypothetical protein